MIGTITSSPAFRDRFQARDIESIAPFLETGSWDATEFEVLERFGERNIIDERC